MNFALALKFAPFIVIAGLVGILLFMRGDLNKTKGERDIAKAVATQVIQINTQNAEVMKQQAEAVKFNEQVLGEVSAKIEAVNTRTNANILELRKVMKNDKAARDWSSVPIPSSLLDAANGNKTANPR